MNLYAVIIQARSHAELPVCALIDAEDRADAIKKVFMGFAKRSKKSGYSDYWSDSAETVRVYRIEYDFTTQPDAR